MLTVCPPAARLGNYIYVAGGRDVPSDNIISSIERFDAVGNSWQVVYHWSSATSDGVAFSYSMRYLVLVGGYDAVYNSLTQTVSYDTVTNTTSLLNPMYIGRGDTSLSQIGNIVYVLGGWSSTQGFCEPLTDVEAFNINTVFMAQRIDLVVSHLPKLSHSFLCYVLIFPCLSLSVVRSRSQLKWKIVAPMLYAR